MNMLIKKLLESFLDNADYETDIDINFHRNQLSDAKKGGLIFKSNDIFTTDKTDDVVGIIVDINDLYITVAALEMIYDPKYPFTEYTNTSDISYYNGLEEIKKYRQNKGEEWYMPYKLDLINYKKLKAKVLAYNKKYNFRHFKFGRCWTCEKCSWDKDLNDEKFGCFLDLGWGASEVGYNREGDNMMQVVPFLRIYIK